MREERFTLTRTNLYEQVADHLEEMILSDDDLKEEDKLPSETALAEQFGVSRNVIRESLKLLKERGLIDSRNGTGSYITKPEAENIAVICEKLSQLIFIVFVIFFALAVAFLMSVPRREINTEFQAVFPASV